MESDIKTQIPWPTYKMKTNNLKISYTPYIIFLLSAYPKSIASSLQVKACIVHLLNVILV